ncbi:MAG: hypothetical protein JXQ29_12780, partial [Planctomycetes bacterium]|nr:hypothetical protein [Planctomycetota bacterium]
MVAPGLPKWSHRALSRARCEVARLEALRVLRFDEAACLRLAIAVRERELPVREADLGGASALCSLLQELAEAGDETRLSPAVIERLAEHYAPRRPDLAHLLDPLASRPAGAVPPAPPVSPPEKAVDESPPAAPASAEALPAERLAAAWSLARFLEAVNIGWGMLAASLLIVGCSIALVITLWQSNVPVIRYLAFLGVALGLNGVGQFAHRRLRLAITGHTVLAVSMLLMPLNLVAAEVLGGAAGRAVSPAASAMILLGFAAVAWSSLRLVCPAGAVTASVTFAVLIGLELAVEPLRAHGAVAELAVAWAGTAVYLAGLALTFRRRRSAGAVGPAPVVFTGGVLAFAHLVLWARVHLDGLGQGQFDRIAPVVVLYLLAGLCIGRELRRVAVARAWARPAAAALDTLAHLAVPLVLLVMAPANGGRLLVSSLAALALYGTVAGWYRSRLAAGAAAAATVVAGYAGLTLLHEWSRGEFSWLPVSWPQLAFEMLPLVAAFLIAGEALARRRRGDSATAAAWAAPVLLGAGGVLATLLLGAMIPDGPRLGEAVALVGGLALILALGTRRRAYAHAALAALPIVLALRPGVVADLVEAKTLVVWLGAVGILYFAAGSRLARDRVPLAATFARPFVVTALLLMPPILLATFLPEITGLSVVGPLACLLLCAGAAGIRPAVHLAELAGAFYVLAAGLAIHHWVAPIADPVPASVAWALAAAVPLLA